MSRTLLLAIGLAIGACQVQVQAPQAPGPSARPATARTGAPGGAAATPKPPDAAATAAPGGAAAARKLERLLPPEGAASRLKGSVKVDAASLVAAGAGNVRTHQGATIVAAGAGRLIGPDGAGLIGPDGAGLIGPDGAGLIGPDGAGLIGPDGAGLIGPDGAGLIGPDGAGLIGPDGAGLVAAGAGNLVAAASENRGGLRAIAGAGGLIVAAGAGNALPVAPRYALAQAARAPRAGEQLPAAGMLVSVVSLDTRKYLPLGRDGAGRAVYAVYSGPDGGFEVWVPPGEEKNLLIIAQPPRARDPRLVYNVLAAREAASQPVDQVTAAGTRYLRRAMVKRVAAVMQTLPPAQAAEVLTVEGANVPDVLVGLVTDFAVHLRWLAEQRGIDRSTPAPVVEAMAQAMTDAALAHIDLEAIEIPDNDPGAAGEQDRSAVRAVGRVMGELYDETRERLWDPQDQSRYSRTLGPDFLAKVNAPAAGLPSNEPVPPLVRPDRVIERPADVVDFVIEEYLSTHRHHVWGPLINLYAALDGDAAKAADRIYLLQAGVRAVGTTLVAKLAPDWGDPKRLPPAENRAAAAAARAALEYELPKP